MDTAKEAARLLIGWLMLMWLGEWAPRALVVSEIGIAVLEHRLPLFVVVAMACVVIITSILWMDARGVVDPREWLLVGDQCRETETTLVIQRRFSPTFTLLFSAGALWGWLSVVRLLGESGREPVGRLVVGAAALFFVYAASRTYGSLEEFRFDRAARTYQRRLRAPIGSRCSAGSWDEIDALGLLWQPGGEDGKDVIYSLSLIWKDDARRPNGLRQWSDARRHGVERLFGSRIAAWLDVPLRDHLDSTAP